MPKNQQNLALENFFTKTAKDLIFASQLRVEIADALYEEVLQSMGYTISKQGYLMENQSQAFELQVKNIAGSECILTIALPQDLNSITPRVVLLYIYEPILVDENSRNQVFNNLKNQIQEVLNSFNGQIIDDNYTLGKIAVEFEA